MQLTTECVDGVQRSLGRRRDSRNIVVRFREAISVLTKEHRPFEHVQNSDAKAAARYDADDGVSDFTKRQTLSMKLGNTGVDGVKDAERCVAFFDVALELLELRERYGALVVFVFDENCEIVAEKFPVAGVWISRSVFDLKFGKMVANELIERHFTGSTSMRAFVRLSDK